MLKEKFTTAGEKLGAYAKEHKFRTALFSMLALSMALQATPDIVSTPAEDYARKNEYAAKLAPRFRENNTAQKDIRVYRTPNPLNSLHAAGHALIKTIKDPDTPILGKAALVVFAHYAIPSAMVMDALAGTSAIPAEKNCYITPPKRSDSVAEFISYMSSDSLEHITDDSVTLKTRNDPQQLLDILLARTLAHEEIHCVQDRGKVADRMGESDSDIRSHEMLAAAGYDADSIQEAFEIVRHARALAPFNVRVEEHATALALSAGKVSPLDQYLAMAAYSVLKDMSEDLIETIAFPDEMDDAEKKYHVIKTIVDSGAFGENSMEHKVAKSYIEAVDYFNGMAGGVLLKAPDFFKSIDISILTKNAPSMKSAPASPAPSS